MFFYNNLIGDACLEKFPAEGNPLAELFAAAGYAYANPNPVPLPTALVVNLAKNALFYIFRHSCSIIFDMNANRINCLSISMPSIIGIVIVSDHQVKLMCLIFSKSIQTIFGFDQFKA